MKANSRTPYTVLGMLTIQSMSGYDIAKIIEHSTRYFWSESEGQIYPTLAWCVKQGYATCKENKTTKGTRSKKIYTITQKGRKFLVIWLEKQPISASGRNELLLKLFFGDNLPVEINCEHLVAQQKKVEAMIVNFNKIQEELTMKEKNAPQLNYWLITVNYGLKLAKAELAWCKESLKLLQGKVI
jgi:DNA-binding PadR family transcriptional regulator